MLGAVHQRGLCIWWGMCLVRRRDRRAYSWLCLCRRYFDERHLGIYVEKKYRNSFFSSLLIIHNARTRKFQDRFRRDLTGHSYKWVVCWMYLLHFQEGTIGAAIVTLTTPSVTRTCCARHSDVNVFNNSTPNSYVECVVQCTFFWLNRCGSADSWMQWIRKTYIWIGIIYALREKTRKISLSSSCSYFRGLELFGSY